MAQSGQTKNSVADSLIQSLLSEIKESSPFVHTSVHDLLVGHGAVTPPFKGEFENRRYFLMHPEGNKFLDVSTYGRNNESWMAHETYTDKTGLVHKSEKRVGSLATGLHDKISKWKATTGEPDWTYKPRTIERDGKGWGSKPGNLAKRTYTRGNR